MTFFAVFGAAFAGYMGAMAFIRAIMASCNGQEDAATAREACAVGWFILAAVCLRSL